MRRYSIPVAIGAYLAAVVYLTLIAFPQDHPPPNFELFRTIKGDLSGVGNGWLRNFCGNLAAFIPFGLLLAAAGRGWRAVLLSSFALSLAIETGQYVLGTRVADLDDLLLNTISGGLGLALFVLGRWLSQPLGLVSPRLEPGVNRGTPPGSSLGPRSRYSSRRGASRAT